MRKDFARWAETYGISHPEFIFLTGDLGFDALEKVRDGMGARFINAGVSEQNMITMAASLAHQGLSPVCYSIAPFAVFRPAEQIRVDVCLHDMNVKVIGNGGGYGYGIMGATHHALEDIGVLSGFQNMRCYVPVANETVESTCFRMMEQKGPGYLRMGFGVLPKDIDTKEAGAPIFQLYKGTDVTVVGLGPVTLNAVQAVQKLGLSADIFAVQEMPVVESNQALLDSIAKTRRVLVIEEHVSRGGLGENLSLILATKETQTKKFRHLCAKGYPNHRYGSQAYHQKQCGLDSESIQQTLRELTT